MISAQSSILFLSTALGLLIGYEGHKSAKPANIAPPQIIADDGLSQAMKALQWSTLPTKMDALVTAYCPCLECCGEYSDGITSRGRDAKTTRGVAVDPRAIPYGSIVNIPGYGSFVADDTGGAMRRDWDKGILHIDLRFNDHCKALEFGRKNLAITVEMR